MRLRLRLRLSLFLVSSTASVLSPLSATAASAEVVVTVSGVVGGGEIGCALFGSGSGFPMDNSTARRLWLPADVAGVTCRFAEVPEGAWAVSVSHDLNGNRKVDTNFFGIPTEAWGVSNNARPLLRAPRFDEASFKVTAGQPVALDIKVAK